MARNEAWRDEDGARPEDGTGRDPADDAADHEGERRRREARAHFLTVPPYRIAPDLYGKHALSRKYYEFWQEDDPAAAARWRLLSEHDSFEEAERRLRVITSPPVYYDARGRLAQGPPLPEDTYGLPPEDEDE